MMIKPYEIVDTANKIKAHKENDKTIAELVKMQQAYQTRTRMRDSCPKGDSLIFIQIATLLGFPTPKDGCPGNTINSKGECSHAQIAIVGSAHLLHIFEPSGHVRPQFIVYFLLIPHETLNVLQVTKPPSFTTMQMCAHSLSVFIKFNIHYSSSITFFFPIFGLFVVRNCRRKFSING